jgi:hypothetical protein
MKNWAFKQKGNRKKRKNPGLRKDNCMVNGRQKETKIVEKNRILQPFIT